MLTRLAVGCEGAADRGLEGYGRVRAHQRGAGGVVERRQRVAQHGLARGIPRMNVAGFYGHQQRVFRLLLGALVKLDQHGRRGGEHGVQFLHKPNVNIHRWHRARAASHAGYRIGHARAPDPAERRALRRMISRKEEEGSEGGEGEEEDDDDEEEEEKEEEEEEGRRQKNTRKGNNRRAYTLTHGDQPGNQSCWHQGRQLSTADAAGPAPEEQKKRNQVKRSKREMRQ